MPHIQQHCSDTMCDTNHSRSSLHQIHPHLQCFGRFLPDFLVMLCVCYVMCRFIRDINHFSWMMARKKTNIANCIFSSQCHQSVGDGPQARWVVCKADISRFQAVRSLISIGTYTDDITDTILDA